MAKASYRFMQNRQCEYFPCHKRIAEEDFNCLFGYCPLYTLGRKCGGNFHYTAQGRKSCVDCTFPHHEKMMNASSPAMRKSPLLRQEQMRNTNDTLAKK